MSNMAKSNSLTEEEYRKKILTPLYDSSESREEVISYGNKQIEELREAERIILEQMVRFIDKYKDQ